MTIITHELLRSWNPCIDGYKRFCELFPNGAYLQTAMDELIKDEHDNWAYWLFCAARDRKMYPEIILKGYRNSGNRNSGYRNSGNRNSGDWNNGNRNSGNRNSGDCNSGGWNSGDCNSGYFNIDIPPTVRVFGMEISRYDWEAAYKPKFLFFNLNVWVEESKMTDSEKEKYPSYAVTGGYLKKQEYKEAFKESWDKADKADRIKIKDLPNFNKDIFFEISGINVDKE